MTNFIAYVEDPGAANFRLKAVMTRAGHQLNFTGWFCPSLSGREG